MAPLNVPASTTWPQIPAPYKPITQAGNLSRCKPAGTPSGSERMQALDYMQLQQRFIIREYISCGSYGQNPNWQFNAKGSYNIKDHVDGTIVSAAGNEITIDFGVDPRGLTLFQARRLAVSEFGSFWIPGFGGFGPPQPGMSLTYGTESVLGYKSAPLIRKIISCSGNVMTFLLNQTCNNAMTPSTPDTPPVSYTVKIWNQYGNMPDWLKIQQPVWFPAVEKKPIFHAVDLPDNKILALENTRVAQTPGFNNQQIFLIEACTDESPDWTPIGDSANRLFVRTHDTTPATYDSVVALGSTKPDYASPDAPSISDLTTTYAHFRITYWKYKANGCEAPCQGGCLKQRYDYNGSIKNIPSDVGGVGVTAGGKVRFCEEASWYKEVLSDNFDRSDPTNIVPGHDGIPDTAALEKKHPTGIANFPADGSDCYQPGVCDRYEDGSNNTSNRARWHYGTHASRFASDMTGACSMRQIQKMPGFPQSWNFEDQNIKHTSLQWQAGFAFVTSTTASLHPGIVVRTPGLGKWTSKVEIGTDALTGLLYLRPMWSFNWHAVVNESTRAITLSDGAFPAAVADFKPGRDPLDPTGTIEMMEIERLGVRVNRDTGEIRARGLDNFSVVLPPVTALYAEGFDVTRTGEVQQNDTVTFERFAA